MKTTVIFDMDGVLVDNSHIHLEAFVIFCKRYGVPMDAETLRPYFGKGNDEILPAVMGRSLSEQEIIDYSEEKEIIYRDIFAQRIEPMKGLVPLLEDLRSRGIKLGVGSSGMSKNVEFVLDKCGIKEYFTAISNGDMIKRAKPDPEVFLLAADLLGSDPSECLVFEDSFAGRDAARAAGMSVIGLSTTYPGDQMVGFDAVIDDFTQIDGGIVKSI